MIHFENNFLDNIYEFFINIALNLNESVGKRVSRRWIYSVLRIIWFFFSRLRITINIKDKTKFKG